MAGGHFSGGIPAGRVWPSFLCIKWRGDNCKMEKRGLHGGMRDELGMS